MQLAKTLATPEIPEDLNESEKGFFGILLETLKTQHRQIKNDINIASVELGLPRIINVKDSPYHAKGDGVTDDGAAVKAAIEALTDGDVLFFPAGDYLLTTYTAASIITNITMVSLNSENTTIIGPDTSTNFIELDANGNIVLKSIGFSTFQAVVAGTTEDTDYIVIDSCKADSVKNLYKAVGESTSGDVSSFRVNNCKLTNISDIAIRLTSPVIKFASITNNEFINIGVEGMRIGYNDSISNNCYEITGNYFYNIDGSTGTQTSTRAILCYGKSAVIANNVVNSVSNAGGAHSQGIYTKCTNTVIVGNVLYDAGVSQGAIVVKGGKRNIIANNNIYFSTERLYNGIHIEAENPLINDNVIENAFIGIEFYGQDGPSIADNFIFNSGRGIYIYVATDSSITGISITGNMIVETGADDANEGIGIKFYSRQGGISNVVINDNIIQTVETDGSPTSKGIHLTCSAGISYLSMAGNVFDGMDNAIYFEDLGGTLTYVLTTDNIFNSIASTVVSSEVYSGTGSKIKDNIGFVTENGGKATGKSTGQTIAHGLVTTPTIVNVVPATAGVSDLNVAADGTNITVTFAGGGSEDFYWEAKVR